MFERLITPAGLFDTVKETINDGVREYDIFMEGNGLRQGQILLGKLLL